MQETLKILGFEVVPGIVGGEQGFGSFLGYLFAHDSIIEPNTTVIESENKLIRALQRL